jgi:tRNA(Ile)-lysidine synthase
MTALAARVLATLRRRRLLAHGTRVLAAVSGGADSVALAHLLAELSAAGTLQLVAVAHFDHCLRGAESARDAGFCRDLAGALDVPFDVEAVDVAGEAKRRKTSIESTARGFRYAFLERARARANADVVAVAHTSDDQAETVLLRLFRGAGTRGLGGIPPARDRVIRPLIDLVHAELTGYLLDRNRTWMEDSTNQDRAIPRNWVRHELLPLASSRYGDLTARLARSADLVRADDEALEAMTTAAAARVVSQLTGTVALDISALLAEPVAIQRRLLRLAIERSSGRAASWTLVSALVDVVEAGRAVSVRLGPCQVELSSAAGVLSIRSPHSRPARPPSWPARALPVPGAVEVPEAGCRVRAERRGLQDIGGMDALATAEPQQAVAAGIESDLVVRAWQPGDLMQVLGSSGRKKVQDLFVDRKVPRSRRHQVPIVTDAEGRIVWVAGLALGEAFRVTPATKSVVVLNFEPLGGPE